MKFKLTVCFPYGEKCPARGLLAIIKARVDENWFGEAFPTECQDGGHNIGCDTSKLTGALKAYKVRQLKGF